MKAGRKPSGIRDAAISRILRAACMRRARAVREEAARAYAEQLHAERFALELEVYGPTMPSSCLNPRWFSVGGH